MAANSTMALVVKYPRCGQFIEEKNLQDAYNADHPLADICLTSTTGLGLFATQDIQRGTRIICEAPLISLRSAECKPSKLYKHLDSLMPAQLDEFDSLSSNDHCEIPDHHSKKIRNALLSDQKSGQSKAELEYRIDIQVTRFAVWKTNALQLNTAQVRYGIFLLSSRINHSCTPNVYTAYNTTLEKLTVHAIRDLQAGEELVSSYINPTQSFIRRQSALSAFDINCSCDLCASSRTTYGYDVRSAPSYSSRSEKLREFINDREQALRIFEGTLRVTMPNPVIRLVPRSNQEALKLAEQNVAFLKEANLTDTRLAEVLSQCAKYCLLLSTPKEPGQNCTQKELTAQISMLGKARGYAEARLDVEICCYGADSPLLTSAEACLNNIISVEVEKNAALERLVEGQKCSLKTNAKKFGKKKGKR